MKITFITAIITLIANLSFGQTITIDNSPTPTDLVTNTLIGPGLTTSNITFSGDAQQIGKFFENGSSLGLDSGIVLSTGTVNDITGAPGGWGTDFFGPGDNDILTTAQQVRPGISSTNDAAILEFDFVPDGDVVTFNFVFASNEYYTYINSDFNDAFGFYISGANPAGGQYNVENVALVPGTTDPITISTIYDYAFETPPQRNAEYFAPSFSGVGFEAGTIPINITFNVICDSTYHFKFAIADCVDGALDTGVFLEGGSFQSIPVDINLGATLNNNYNGEDAVIEGCSSTNTELVFSRPECNSDVPLDVPIDITGTATNGVDYNTLNDTIHFLANETDVIFPLGVMNDGVTEGPEYFTITITNVLTSGDTVYTAQTIWILDPEPELTAYDTTLYCTSDSVQVFTSVDFGVPPYTYSWQGLSDTTESIYVMTDQEGSFDYIVTVIDSCGNSDTDTLTVLIDQELTIQELLSNPSSSCEPTGLAYNNGFPILTTGNASPPVYQWNGPDDPNLPIGNALNANNLSSGMYYFTVTDDFCTTTDSVFVDVNIAPIASMTVAPISGCSPLTVNFTNTSQNATNFNWNFGDGNTMSSSGLTSESHEYTISSDMYLVAIADDGCTDTTYQSITIDICGCTDPNGTNYNEFATVDDGSCIYPEPVVVAPNIFTPNDDGNNDIFELDAKYTDMIQLVITNRWGNVVYEGESANPAWDGKTSSGGKAEEGTYFYKYTATGIYGDQITGHGFVQLVRD